MIYQTVVIVIIVFIIILKVLFIGCANVSGYPQELCYPPTTTPRKIFKFI